jgi:hypothetical protein
MVGMVGLAPTEAVRPGDLQSPAIAAMRHTQIGPPEWTRTTILRLSSAGTTLSYRRKLVALRGIEPRPID